MGFNAIMSSGKDYDFEGENYYNQIPGIAIHETLIVSSTLHA